MRSPGGQEKEEVEDVYGMYGGVVGGTEFIAIVV